jgi:hypothetical protein
MINLTSEQAQTLLEIVCNDIQLSEMSEPEYKSVETMRFYLNRAILAEILESAIKGAAQ